MATGLVVNKTQVYFGPNTTQYPSDNSYAGPNDTVTILWKEGSWYYIEYPAGTNRKRMYITASAVSNISGSVSNYTANLQTRYIHIADKTYWGPGTVYPQAGSVSYGETVSYVSPKREGDYVLIEYAVSGGKKKRAYIHGNSLGTSAPTGGGFYDYIANGWTLTSPWKNENSQSGQYYGHLGNDLVKGTTKIKALADGIVHSVSQTSYSSNGWTVTLRHVAPNGKTYYSFYAHMNSKAPLTVDTAIKAGDDIHDVGWGGLQSSGAKHVHIGVYTGTPIDNMYGYNKVNGVNTLFNDNGTGIWEYKNIVFYDALRVVSTKGKIIQ